MENTWSGVHIHASRHKSFPTSIVQKSPPQQSITNFTDQSLQRFCGEQYHHNFDQQFFLYVVYSIFGVLFVWIAVSMTYVFFKRPWKIWSAP